MGLWYAGGLPFLKTRHGPRNVRLEAFKGFGSRFVFLKASSVRGAEGWRVEAWCTGFRLPTHVVVLSFTCPVKYRTGLFQICLAPIIPTLL